jgi:hypothetical protein
MAIKVGNTYVSETAYAQAKAKIESEQKGGKNSVNGYLSSLQQKMSGWNLSTNTQPYSGGGLNNISIHPSILREMANDPDKRLEYEALLIDIQNTSASVHMPKGMKLIAQGYIIDANGGLSSWSITQTESNKIAKTNSMLPKDKTDDWNDLLLGRFLKDKNKPYEDSNDGIYIKV